MKINKFLLIASIIILTLSCEDDFLDVIPNAPTPEIALSDPEVAPEVVNAIYDVLQGFNFNSPPYYGVSEIASDNANKGSSPGDTGAFQQALDDFDFNPTTAAFDLLWESHFQGIGRANQALGFLEVLEIDDDLRSRLTGESLFLRALMYFRLAQMYGGLPIIDKTPDPQSVEEINSTLIRTSLEETFAFIKNDLTEAAGLLPEKSAYALDDLGRATRGAALTLLAKVNLYEQNWTEARDIAQEVISSGEYGLQPEFIDIFKQEFENGIESIFEIQGRGTDPQDGGGHYHFTQGARGPGGWGWGFNEPSEDLINSYEEEDERLESTVIFRGTTLYDGRPVDPEAVNPTYNYKAYIAQEFTPDEKNVPLLRYGELLLIHAEAAVQAGDSGASQGSLDLLRSRAGLASIPATLENIYLERRREMALENDRIHDLRRTGRAAQVLNAAGIPFQAGRHEFYPIPQQQVDISNGLLVQNPGY